jgi:uncharacterized protein YdeI (YjbR/CyaY-like superfamily)
MAAEIPLLEVTTRAEWRAWLAKHHNRDREIWLVFWKKHTGRPCVPYAEAVDEALCFGWIDSLVRRLDDDRYAQKFTPRQAKKSGWTELNRRRFARLVEEGRMTPAGLAKGPPAEAGGEVGPGGLAAGKPGGAAGPARRIAEAGAAAVSTPAADVEAALRAAGEAWANFSRLAPSHRRNYLGWIEAAKRPETRGRRIAETAARLARGEKLGLK